MLKKQMLVVMLILLTVFVGFGIIIPVLPVMVEASGDAGLHLALLLSLYSAVSFFMSPLWGALSDKWGRRPIILVGLLGFSAGFFLFGISDDRLWLMYASRLIGGLFSGAVTACAVAYVADITSDETRTKGMGLVGMSIGLGFVIGPGIGGGLSLFGHGAPFFAAAGLSLAAWIFALSSLPESLGKEAREKHVQAPKQSRWSAFQGSLKYLYMLSFIVSFTLSGLESVFQLFQMKRIGADPFSVGMMLLACGVVGAFIQGGVVRKRIKKGSEKMAIRAGLLLSAAGFILILLSSSWLTATVYLCVFGTGNALIRPCVTSLITQKTTVGQGVATGLMSSMDSLGRILGPLAAMGTYGLSEGYPFLFGGALCLAALLLLGRYSLLEKSCRAQPDEATALS